MAEARPTAGEIAPPLLRYLRRALDAPALEFAEPPARLADGVSARVFSLRTSGGPPATDAPLVCRIYCDGSHDVTDAQARAEAALQRALANAGVPTPPVIAAGGRGDGLGAPFLVMERARGADGMRSSISAMTLAAVAAALGAWPFWALGVGLVWGVPAAVLRRLHRVPGAEVASALAAAGVPPESLGLDRALDGLAELVDASDRPGAGEVLAWLREHRPSAPARPTACHGDFWFGNLLVTRRGPVLIDWTQAALGDRELDLGWMSIQHYSRLPLPLADPAFDWLWLPLRPFVWLWLAPIRWLYRLGGGVDARRLAYYTALCALRVLTSGDRLARTAGGDRRTAETSAWGSPHTTALLRWRLWRITGLRVGPRAGR